MGVEAVSGRVGGMFGDELEIAVKLHHSARRMAAGAAHHRYQKTTLGQSVELVGDGRQRRIGGAEGFWFSRIGTIKKEDLLLPLEDAQQAAASKHAPVGRESDVMWFIGRCAGVGNLSR